MNTPKLKIGLIAPLPPPHGGMANQAVQLKKLLESEGANVEVVQVNSPYAPEWIGSIKGVRAVFRFIPYVYKLLKCASRVQVFHVMANSGWSWHLFAAPAVWVGVIKNTPVIVNYRGGEAGEFFRRAFKWIKPTINQTSLIAVPSNFLKSVFSDYGISAEIIPNIIDLEKFSKRERFENLSKPHIVVARNLEPIYDVETAIKAFSKIGKVFPEAKLSIAGEGPEKETLESVVTELRLRDKVTFTGRLNSQEMADLYQTADIMLNPSLADNMPNSILEAWASGIPVVSTNVGGIPFLVEDNKTALLVDPGLSDDMARAALKILDDEDLRNLLISSGNEQVKDYAWSRVCEKWFTAYLNVHKSFSNANK